MTCISALVKDGHVWMAGDLMGSNGYTGKVYSDSKVFVNGDFIIGYTSSFRMGQLLEFNWVQPPRLEGMEDREYLQISVVESLRSCFQQYGYGIKDGVEDIGGNFLIGYRGCVYEMQHNFSLLKHEDYVACGSGIDYATSAMSVLIDNAAGDFDPYDVLQTAIGTAAKFVTSVSAECTILTTDQDAVDAKELSLKEESEKEEEEMRSWSKDQLLSFMFDEDYTEDGWKADADGCNKNSCEVPEETVVKVFSTTPYPNLSVMLDSTLVYDEETVVLTQRYKGDLQVLCYILGIEYKDKDSKADLILMIEKIIEEVIANYKN